MLHYQTTEIHSFDEAHDKHSLKTVSERSFYFFFFFFTFSSDSL